MMGIFLFTIKNWFNFFVYFEINMIKYKFRKAFESISIILKVASIILSALYMLTRLFGISLMTKSV